METPDTSAADAPGQAQGLTSAEAARRLTSDGPNVLTQGRGRHWLTIARDTLGEPMFLLLLAASALYLLLGDRQEGVTLLVFVLLILGLTLFQEGRTERAIEALRDLTSPRALVVRDGRTQRISGSDVVRGDLLLLSEGDRVPADAWLLSGEGMRVDESLLTGEAVPVGKRVATADERLRAEGPGPFSAVAPGGEDQAVVFAGTLIVQGSASARVSATGTRSAIGRIGSSLSAVDDVRSPLQRQTAQLVRRLALIALLLSLLLILMQGLSHGNWLQALLAGVALAMAILPEEYPVVMTVFPALGARRLAREGVLTRRITAIETLGATTVLCSDKTGTLTENRMSVARLLAGGPDLPCSLEPGATAQMPWPAVAQTLVETAALASLPRAFDPMEQAFHRLAQDLPETTPGPQPTLVRSYPLSASLRAMTQVWAQPGQAGHRVCTKGAPETVMELCRLGTEQRAHIGTVIEGLAGQGYRVLAVAEGSLEGEDWPEDQRGFALSFLGLMVLADPVRAEVPEAVAQCHRAGIRVLMITGDYPATALAIARQAGLLPSEAPAQVLLTGEAMDALDDDALAQRMPTVLVCARIAPAQKLRIVKALQAQGEVVAMTGDGVNDAPALRAAHVGVAMGGRGTDVAREAADLVLVDDNFAAIVRAVRLGRRIFDNLRKAMSYLLAVHVPIAGMALLPLLLGWPPLLLPMHIALLEAIIDPACSIAFENEPAEPDSMARPPRDAAAPLFSGSGLLWPLLQGLGVLAAVLAGFAWAQPIMSEPQARAFAFVTLVAGNLSLILINRSPRRALLATLRMPNPAVWWVLALAICLTLAALHWAWAQEALRFDRLSAAHLALAAALGAVSVVWFEAVKWARRRRSVA